MLEMNSSTALGTSPGLSVYPERVPMKSGRVEGLTVADEKNCWYLYLLRCADGSICTGITNDDKKALERATLYMKSMPAWVEE